MISPPRRVNTPVTIDVTANDVATNGDPFSITTFTQPTNGTVTQVGNNFIYTPSTGFIGIDQFTYTICDDDGCDVATVTVVVQEGGTQSPPIANDDFAGVNINTPTPINVTANDQATDGDAFTITSFTQPNNGTVALVGGQLIYTPNTNFVGNDTLTYTICDNDGCDTATVYIFVEGTPTQSPPIANNDNATTTVNTPVTIDVTANDQATDGDAFTIDSFTQPTNGTVTQVGDDLVYTPNSGFTGTDTFIYTICDNDGCDTATVTVTVQDGGAQTPPIANDDNATTTEGNPVTVDVLANDQATDGDAYTLTEFTQPTNGTVALVDSRLVYTPNTDFTGTDTFTYTLCDNDGCDAGRR